MGRSLFFLCSLVLYRLAALYQQKQMFFEGRPGLAWDDCLSPVSSSDIKCAIQCLGIDNCLGFNYDKKNPTSSSSSPLPGTCHLCLSNQTKTISKVPPNQTLALFFGNSTVVYAPTSEQFYTVTLPDGLFDGQAVIFRTKRNVHDWWMIFFSDSKRFDLDLEIHIKPNNISLEFFDMTFGNSIERCIHGFNNDYSGIDTDVIILVHESDYTAYVDGNFICVCPRSGTLPLRKIKSIYLRSI